MTNKQLLNHLNDILEMMAERNYNLAAIKLTGLIGVFTDLADKTRQKQSEAGKIGAARRWNKEQ
jgi:hypothetical protein